MLLTFLPCLDRPNKASANRTDSLLKWKDPKPWLVPSSSYRRHNEDCPPTTPAGSLTRLYWLDPFPYRLVVQNSTSRWSLCTFVPFNPEASTHTSSDAFLA